MARRLVPSQLLRNGWVSGSACRHGPGSSPVASITVCDLVHSVDLGHTAVTPKYSVDLSEPI